MALFARLLRGNTAAAVQAEPAPTAALAAPAAATDDLVARVRESLNLLEADLRELIGRVGRAADRVHEGIGASTHSLDTIRANTREITEVAN